MDEISKINEKVKAFDTWYLQEGKMLSPSVIITHIQTKKEIDLGHSIFAHALAKLISLFSNNYAISTPANLNTLQETRAVTELRDSVHQLRAEAEKKIPLHRREPLTSTELQTTLSYLDLLNTPKQNLIRVADKMQTLQERLLPSGKKTPPGLREEIASLHEELENHLSARVQVLSTRLREIRTQGLNNQNASDYLRLTTELVSYRSICPPNHPVQKSIAQFLPTNESPLALLAKANPAIQQGLRNQLTETAKWSKEYLPELQGLKNFSQQIQQTLEQLFPKSSAVDPQKRALGQLEELQQHLAAYRGSDALAAAREFIPGLEERIKTFPVLKDAYQVMINEANVRSFLSQPLLDQMSEAEEMTLNAMGIVVTPAMKKEFTRLVQQDIQKYTQIPLPGEIIKELSETPSKEMIQKMRKRMTQHVLTVTGKKISTDNQKKLIATLLQVSKQSGQVLSSLMSDSLWQKNNISSEKIMGHLLNSFQSIYGEQLRKKLGKANQSEIDKFVTDKFTELKEEYLKTLKEVTQEKQFSNTEKTWLKENRQFRMWASSQVTDQHRVLGEGVCFANSIAVASYVAYHPTKSPNEVQEHLASRLGGKETSTAITRATSTQHFSTADRFFQALYDLEVQKSAFDSRSAPGAILSKYKVTEKQIAIPTFINNPRFQKEGSTQLAIEYINERVAQEALKASYGTFVLILDEKKGPSAHAIVLRIDPEKKIYSLYDPNYGWYEYPDRMSFTQGLSTYLQTIQKDMVPVQLNAYIPKKS